MASSRRTYRSIMSPKAMRSFTVKVKETDLWIAVDQDSYYDELPPRVEDLVWLQRRLLEGYICRDPLFEKTLSPYLLEANAPALALEMVRAGNTAGVGPMAAVAGAFAELVGRFMLTQGQQVMVENGGDLFLKIAHPCKIKVLAGQSSFGERLCLNIPPREEPWGICTSSGTVGPSYSEGLADAAVILSASAPLADAVATATANRVRSEGDLKAALEFAQKIPGVEGILIIIKGKMAAWGQVQLSSLS